MLIVDAQVHIWESGTPISHHRQVPAYTKDELLRDMDAAGVSAVVLHPPSWDPRANEVAIDAARQHPDRLAILGFFDFEPPGEPVADRRLEAATRHAGPALCVPAAGRGELARRRHGGLAVAGGGAGRTADRAPRVEPAQGRRRDRREASAAEAPGRSHGAARAAAATTRVLPIWAICSRWRNTPTSRSRPPARRAIRAIPGRTATSTST